MNYLEVQNRLNAYLNLEREPVGVKFHFDSSECAIPPRKYKTTYCNAIRLASEGQQICLAENSHACSGGERALGVIPGESIKTASKRRVENGSYVDETIAASISHDMVFLSKKPLAITVQPLRYFIEDPDVIVIIAESYQIMRIVQGYSYHYGMLQNVATAGMQAVCQDLTARPYELNQINTSYLCPGTRMIAGWRENEQGVGIPVDLFEKTFDGIKETINPFERNKNKEEIIHRLNSFGYDSTFIQMNKNYDDGSYVGGKTNY